MKSANGGIAQDSRERLLRAGTAVFVERGYRRATVREIVACAGVNLAAVNYHFRGKAGLYSAVLERAAQAALEKHPPYGGSTRQDPPEEQLRAFTRAFLHRLFDAQDVHGRLMAGEMIEPSPALASLVKKVIRPLYSRLCAVVRQLVGRHVPQAKIELAAKSVVGQILFYKNCAPVLARLDGRLPEPREIDAIADHITAFSLEGLRGMRARK